MGDSNRQQKPCPVRRDPYLFLQTGESVLLYDIRKCSISVKNKVVNKDTTILGNTMIRKGPEQVVPTETGFGVLCRCRMAKPPQTLFLGVSTEGREV